MNKIKLTGTRSIPFDGQIDENKEYLVALVTNPISVQVDVKNSEDEERTRTYNLKVHHLEMAQEVGGNRLKVQEGSTPSQRLFFAIKQYHEKAGIDPSYENYEIEINKIIKSYNDKTLDLIV